jgi:hypothetical protein
VARNAALILLKMKNRRTGAAAHHSGVGGRGESCEGGGVSEPEQRVRPNISTRRRLQYARGFVELGMLSEAAGELEAVVGADQLTAEAMEVRIDLHMAAKHWELVVEMGHEFALYHPSAEKGWISWAFALRELDRVSEAKATLLQAEPLVGRSCSVLHYNLACYHCLLGEKTHARARLKKTFQMEQSWKTAALADPDLQAMRDEIAVMN